MKKKLIINFYVTYKCNLSCNYCQVYDNNKLVLKSYNIFFSVEFEKLLLLFKDYDIDIEFFWWEPLLESQFIKKFISIYKDRLNYKITTNWLLLNSTFSFFSTIFISVHYQSIGKLSKLINNWDYDKIKNTIFFTFVIDKDNIDLFYDFALLIKEKGFTKINILPVFCKYNWLKNDLNELNKLVIFLKEKWFILDFLWYENNKKDLEFSMDISWDIFSFTGELIYDENLKNNYYIWNIQNLWEKEEKTMYSNFNKINNYSFVVNANIRQSVRHKINWKQTVWNFVFVNKLLNYYKKNI